MKIKSLLLLFVLFLTFFFTRYTLSAEIINIQLFYSPTCPHCASAKEYFNNLKKDYDQIKINEYEVSKNNKLLVEYYRKYNVPAESQGFVPVIFTKNNFFVGFNDDISRSIKQNIVDLIKNPNQEIVRADKSNKINNLSLIEKLTAKQLALPFIAIILGTLDGFNVCSLGALLIILALVLALKSRIKTLVFGSTFIITTSVIYGFLIFFWYQLFSIITPYLRQMELVIGGLTIFGGVYFLREFLKFRKQGPVCEIGPAQKIEGSFSKKFQSLLENKAKTITIIFSILFFAALITIVEFPCSAAVPVAFAGILTKANLPGWLYILYIILYVIFYMLDELIVFLIAFFTMKLWLTSPKFITWITLLESLIMFCLGAYYLFGLV